MALGIPEEWGPLRQLNISLSEVLGTPDLNADEVASRAAGAFAADVRPAGPSRSLFLLADRLVGAPPVEAVQGSEVAAFAQSVLPTAVPTEDHARHVRTLQSATGHHVVVQQEVRGFDVVGARFCVHYDQAGAYGLTGHPLGDLEARDPGPPPQRSEADVAEAISQRYALEEGPELVVRQVLLPADGAGTWAWFARVPLADPFVDLRLYLRADDLSVLWSYPASVPSLYGEGQVFPVNPLRTPAAVPVCLRGLGPDPANRLTGSRIDVKPGAGDPYVNATRNFNVAPDEVTFDEVAVYHHVSTAITYFSTLVHPDVFDRPFFEPMRVIVHDDRSRRNAYFHPDRGSLTFGDFPGDRYSARSAEMVIHEFGHAITHAICQLPVTPTPQAAGLSEGFSDYFACSALGDPRFGDYVMNRPDGARNCAKPGLKAEADIDGMEPHRMGEVWANSLWGIRTRLGPGVTDSLAMESLYIGGQGLHSIKEAHEALRAADKAMFPADTTTGRHWDLIDTEVGTRFTL